MFECPSWHTLTEARTGATVLPTSVGKSGALTGAPLAGNGPNWHHNRLRTLKSELAIECTAILFERGIGKTLALKIQL